MKHYEVALVLHPDLEIDIEQTTKKIEKLFDSLGIKVDKKDNWGKRKLAYKINKQSWGIYVFYEIQADPSVVGELDSKLRITEEVMRYLIVSLENIKYLKKQDSSKTSKKTNKVEEESKYWQKTSIKQ